MFNNNMASHITILERLCGKCQVSQDQESEENNLKYKTFEEDKTQT